LWVIANYGADARISKIGCDTQGSLGRNTGIDKGSSGWLRLGSINLFQ